MKYVLGFFNLFIFLNCAKLDVQEINTTRPIQFQSFYMKPTLEPNNLRIDIVRQKTSSSSSDANGNMNFSESDLAYHPMGFDLSNGLFYDVQGNLSLRIDRLFNLKDDAEFVLQNRKGDQQKENNRLFTYARDTFKRKSFQHSSLKYMYHKSYIRGEIVVDRRRQNQYSVKFDDTATLFKSGTRPRYTIVHKNPNHFYINKDISKFQYQWEDDEINLGKHFRLVRKDNLIYVYPFSKNRNNPILTIQRYDHGLFVYDQNLSGLKIEMNDTDLKVFRNQHFIESYSLVSN